MPYRNPLKGVYAIKVLENNYIYIGSSSNIKLRYNLHMSAIKKSDTKRYCKTLHDFYKEGLSLELIVLELCNNILEREQYWIEYYKKNIDYDLINVFDADRNNSNVSDDFRNKMSAIRKAKWKEPEYRKIQLENIKATQFKKR